MPDNKAVSSDAQTWALDPELRKLQGIVVGHNLGLFIWIGMAGVALISVQIALWHTRRVLSQSRQVTLVQDIGLSPADLVAPAMAQPAVSVLAS